MPLDRKTAITPVEPEVAAFPEADLGQWFVLHTKSRQEKALSEELSVLRIAHFLPAVEQMRFYGQRKAIVLAPLFPGYLFLRGSIEQAYVADRTKRIASILKVTEQEHLDWELRNIHLALQAGTTFDPYPALKKGVRVQVRSGPLRGVQGVIENRTSRDRLILQVHMLGSAVSIEVDGSLLDLLE